MNALGVVFTAVFLVFSALSPAQASDSISIRIFTAPEWCPPCQAQERAIPVAVPVEVQMDNGQCLQVRFDVRSLNSRNADGSVNESASANTDLLDNSVAPNNGCTFGVGRTIPCSQLMMGTRLLSEHSYFADLQSLKTWILSEITRNQVDVRSLLHSCR